MNKKNTEFEYSKSLKESKEALIPKCLIYALVFLSLTVLIMGTFLSVAFFKNETLLEGLTASLSSDFMHHEGVKRYRSWSWEKNRFSSDGEFMVPMDGCISSRYGWRGIFGRFHYGLDIAAPVGTPIRASKDGKVVFSGYSGGYGILVILKHEDGTETRYGHCSMISAFHGEYVSKGDVIALCGNTGRSTGPHLHFEIRDGDTPLNPELFLLL